MRLSMYYEQKTKNKKKQKKKTPKKQKHYFIYVYFSEEQAKLKEWIRAQDAEFQRKRYEGDGRNTASSVCHKSIPLYSGFSGAPLERITRVD